MTDRLSGNWLSGFGFFTKESEASSQYLWWVAAATLAGALRRRVWAKWGHDKIYPNLYVMLVGPAGSRKTRAINFARKFANGIDIPVSAESTSREGLIWHMMQNGQLQEMNGDLLQTSPLLVAASEFASLYRTSKESLMEFLNDIYDTEQYDDKPWTYETRGRPEPDVIVRPYMTLLSGATPSWIAETLGPGYIDQGLSARTITVYSGGPRFYKAKPNITPEMWLMHGYLLEDLKHISTLHGEFEVTEEAWDWFVYWYTEIYPKQRVDYRLSTYLTRKPLHLWKTAQLISIAETDNLTLNGDHFRTALEQLENTEPFMSRAFTAVGRNPLASRQEVLMTAIQEAREISQVELLDRFGSEVSDAELQEIIQRLILTKRVAPVASRNGDMVYRVTGKGANNGHQDT
jgi:hypothetical protein